MAMKHLTLDASVALKFILDEPGNDAARLLYAREENGQFIVSHVLSAPALILLEVHNTLAKKFGRVNMDPIVYSRAPYFLKRFMNFDVVDEDLIDVARQMSLIAYERSGRAPSCDSQAVNPFNIYDCVYIAHAHKYKNTLVTADSVQADIAAKAFSIPVEVIPTAKDA